MPRGYRVIVEFKVNRSIYVSGNDAADSEEAAELALEEVRNSDEALSVDDFEVVDIIEED